MKSVFLDETCAKIENRIALSATIDVQGIAISFENEKRKKSNEQ